MLCEYCHGWAPVVIIQLVKGQVLSTFLAMNSQHVKTKTWQIKP